MRWHKACGEWCDQWPCGREGELCEKPGSQLAGGRDSCVSGFRFSRFHWVLVVLSLWLARGGHWLVYCPRLSAEPSVSSSQTSHSSTFQPLLTLGKFTDVTSLGSDGTRVCGLSVAESSDVWSDSQFLMSWCACRVSVRPGGRSGRTRFNLWKEMSQSSELSWVKISHTTGVQQAMYSCHCTAHCTEYTLPSVSHLDQLENISVATNKYCDNSESKSKWHPHLITENSIISVTSSPA